MTHTAELAGSTAAYISNLCTQFVQIYRDSDCMECITYYAT